MDDNSIILDLELQKQKYVLIENSSVRYWKDRIKWILCLFIVQSITWISLLALMFFVYNETESLSNIKGSFIIPVFLILLMLTIASNTIYAFYLLLSSIYSFIVYKGQSMLKWYIVCFFIVFAICYKLFEVLDKPKVIDIITDARMLFPYLPVLYAVLVWFRLQKIKKSAYNI